MLEKEIQRQILDYLEIKHIFHWRNNTGAMVSEYKGKKRFMRFGAVGSSDIFALKEGKFYAIEVKTDKGIVSEEQQNFLENIALNDGIPVVARSLDDIIKVFP